MAIDTEDRRRSTLGRLPLPDNEIDQQDRRQVWRLYSGLPEEAPPTGTLMMMGAGT